MSASRVAAARIPRSAPICGLKRAKILHCSGKMSGDQRACADGLVPGDHVRCAAPSSAASRDLVHSRSRRDIQHHSWGCFDTRSARGAPCAQGAQLRSADRACAKNLSADAIPAAGHWGLCFNAALSRRVPQGTLSLYPRWLSILCLHTPWLCRSLGRRQCPAAAPRVTLW